jgi:hemerythrin-like domain-containing protein
VKISELLSEQHRHCHRRLEAFNRSLAEGDWEAAELAALAFGDALHAHMWAEEEHLFPALAQASELARVPIRTMRSEHVQIRALLDDLIQSLVTRDLDRVKGIAETLLVLIRQHDTKEEAVLYALADRLLDDLPPGLRGRRIPL